MNFGEVEYLSIFRLIWKPDIQQSNNRPVQRSGSRESNNIANQAEWWSLQDPGQSDVIHAVLNFSGEWHHKAWLVTTQAVIKTPQSYVTAATQAHELKDSKNREHDYRFTPGKTLPCWMTKN